MFVRRSLSSLTNPELLTATLALLAARAENTAVLLEHLAEIDERQLYLPAAYSSMYAYCLGELKMSEDSAAKKIQAVRAVQKVPALLDAIADERLHLSGVVLLAPHLTQENAGEWIAAAAHSTCVEIRLLIAERAPKPDVPTILQPVTPPNSGNQQDLNPVVLTVAEPDSNQVLPRASVAPLSPQRFALQVTIPQATHDKLRYAQALLGHAVPDGDLAQVLDRALDELVAKLEQRKFAVTSRSRSPRRNTVGRHIPAHVKREVLERDGGQCTFVSDSGHRCESRTRLELDHVTPVARGGGSTADNLRLRCRPHNQFEAERVLGRGYMEEKRAAAKARAAEKKVQREVARSERAAAAEPARLAARAARREFDPDRDVEPWLPGMGFRKDEVRAAAERVAAAMPDAPIKEKLRYALKTMAPRGRCPAA